METATPQPWYASFTYLRSYDPVVKQLLSLVHSDSVFF